MKKLDSLYLIQVRLRLGKYMIFTAVMTAVYLILILTIGRKYAEIGYDYAIAKAGFDKVVNISFFLTGVFYIVTAMINFHIQRTRQMIKPYHPAIAAIASILAAFTFFLLWYAYTIIDWFLVTLIFRLLPSYCGGPQGILYSLTVSSIAREVIPFREPVGFLLNIAKFIPASLIVYVVIAVIILIWKKVKGDK